MDYNDFMIGFSKLSADEKKELAMEILAEANPSDILDGLYMQKTAISEEDLLKLREQLHAADKRNKREMKRQFAQLKKLPGTIIKEITDNPAREYRDSYKLGQMWKAVRKNKKVLAAAGAVGAGAAIGGAALHNEDEKKAFASDIINELYKVASLGAAAKKGFANAKNIAGGVHKTMQQNPELLGAAVVGKGALTAGAVTMHAVKKSKKDKGDKTAAEILNEIYKQAKMTVPDKQEAKKETKSLQDDIECEVCGFKGQPTYDGMCPECGALGGKKPKDEYAKVEEEDLRSWGDPYQGISVEEADYIGRMNEGVV